MRNNRSIRFVILAILLALPLLACSKKPESDAVPAGPLVAGPIHFQFAIYYLPLPSTDPLSVLRQEIAGKGLPLKLTERMKNDPLELLVSAHLLSDVRKEYSPPDLEALRYFGRGLTREEAQALQQSRQALILDFGHPAQKVWQGLRAAIEITEAVARETGGLLWDEETREVFTPDEWHRKRVASWTEDLPVVSDHFTIHAYQSEEFVRAITLGMSKFGLPDVVVEDFPWSMNRPMGNLINLFCQSIAEGATVEESGEFDLDLRAIRNRQVRDAQLDSLGRNGTAKGLLAMKKGHWEEGDPPNRLIEITFDRYPGRDVHARQEKMVSSLFGWRDEVAMVKHDEALLAASRQAKAQVPSLKEAFTAGLQPGEFIQVKAPFATPDKEQEWMWVEVVTWQGSKIRGLLKNEPRFIPSLHGGQIVEIDQGDIFDYIRHFADGRDEGNETGAIIKKMQEEQGN